MVPQTLDIKLGGFAKENVWIQTVVMSLLAHRGLSWFSHPEQNHFLIEQENDKRYDHKVWKTNALNPPK